MFVKKWTNQPKSNSDMAKSTSPFEYSYSPVVSAEDFPAIEAQMCKIMDLMERVMDRMDRGAAQERAQRLPVDEAQKPPKRATPNKRRKLSPEAMAKLRSSRLKIRAHVAEILKKDPTMTLAQVAELAGTSERTVGKVRVELGLPPNDNKRGRGYREKILELIANDPELGNGRCAQIVGCSPDYVADVRRNYGPKRKLRGEI